MLDPDASPSFFSSFAASLSVFGSEFVIGVIEGERDLFKKAAAQYFIIHTNNETLQMKECCKRLQSVFHAGLWSRERMKQKISSKNSLEE